MMRFNINGRVLDTPADFQPSFKRTNNVFSFKDVELSRSVSFTAPKTTNNDIIFKLAGDYRLSGEMAKLNIPAQLQYDGGVMNGYLYVESCDNAGYRCVFVFGILQAIIEMKNAGKIKDNYIYTASDAIISLAKDAIINPSANNPTFALVRYFSTFYTTDYFRNPSIRIYDLLKDMQSLFGVTFVNKSRHQLSDLRMVCAKTKDTNGKEVDWKVMEGSTSILYAQLKDNFPDWTYYELLKHFAQLCGGWLDVRNDTITLYERNSEGYEAESGEWIDGWDTLHLERVLTTGAVKRQFKDFGQHNRVAVESYEYSDNLNVDYSIENSLLKFDNVIYQLPFNDGSKSGVIAGYQVADIQDITKGILFGERDFGNYTEKGTITIVNNTQLLGYITDTPDSITRESYMQKNYDLERLTEACTELSVQVKMNLLEFVNLKEPLFIRYNGVKWVWTEAQWSKGICTLTLQKYE